MSINYRGGLRLRAGIEEKLDAYRRAVKAQTGKLPTRETADYNVAADEIKRLRAVITDTARGDPFHEHPDDAELAPCGVVMDYAAYRFAAKKALEAKGA